MASATSRSHGLRQAQTVLLWVVNVEVAVLALTGLVLFLAYRPSRPFIPGGLVPDIGWLARYGRSAHRAAAFLLLPTLVVTGLLHLVGGRGGPRRGGVSGALVLLLAGASAWVSGRLLDYSAIATYAVANLGRFRGYRVVFDENVRFVLTDHEYRRGDFIGLLLAHTLGIGAGVALGLAALWGGRRARKTE